MRMPPNLSPSRIQGALSTASMEGGMRMPPNQETPQHQDTDSQASMEGGMRMPPNRQRTPHPLPSSGMLQWRAACACRRICQ